MSARLTLQGKNMSELYKSWQAGSWHARVFESFNTLDHVYYSLKKIRSITALKVNSQVMIHVGGYQGMIVEDWLPLAPSFVWLRSWSRLRPGDLFTGSQSTASFNYLRPHP